MLVQVDAIGYRAFVFRADDAVDMFVAINAAPDACGMRNLPLNRIEFGVRGEVEVIPAVSGSCRSVDATATWRAETICEASTLKGRFAAQFVTLNGTAEPVRTGK